MARVIKSEVEYEQVFAHLNALLDQQPMQGTPESDEIELLSVLLEDYENRTGAALESPSPVEAIRFRMEQLGLSQRDLVPFLGSASKASEVLAGKRSLSLNMIRALHTGLGIPATVLMQPSTANERDEQLSWSKFPIREMIRRGWLTGLAKDLTRNPDRTLRTFLAPLQRSAYGVLLKRTEHVRGVRESDWYALIAWLARVVSRARDVSHSTEVDISELIKEVVRFTSLDEGPRIAVEFLTKHGLPVIVEPHLPRTYLDGACIFTDRGPVIGLSVRHDRLDNFWFTLLHELSHAALHAGSGTTVFIDDVETEPGDNPDREADDLARRTLIPDDIWARSPASRLRSRQAVEHLARELRIHPAIVAGRIRRQYNDYSVLGDMVGRGLVRHLFPEFEESAA